MSFAKHPCFDHGTGGVVTIGTACRRLSDTLIAFPEAYEARIALGDPFNTARNRLALRLLSDLPPRVQQKILAADAGKASRDQGGKP